MSREIVNKPHPTPHPDAPHVHGPQREHGAGDEPGSPADQEVASDEMNYDSCLDDLSVVLAAAEGKGDPVLQSPGTADAGGCTAPGGESAARPPRTSEIFRATYASAAGAGSSAEPPEPKAPGEPDAPVRRTGESWLSTLSGKIWRGRLAPPSGTSHDDDHALEPTIPWFSLLLLTYASMVTLALTWMFWTGRVYRQGEPAAAVDSSPSADPIPKTAEPPRLNQERPPLPAANVADLGQTIRIGDLEVTAVSIALASLKLIPAIDPDREQREEPDALVMTLRFRNLSNDQTFAPLERAFVREQSSPLDRSLIETAEGARIGLFPLAYDSEWSILGQEFPVLKPGESAQTIVASEPETAARVRDRATWCIRLRIGLYRTDMVGVRFTRDDIEE